MFVYFCVSRFFNDSTIVVFHALVLVAVVGHVYVGHVKSEHVLYSKECFICSVKFQITVEPH